MYEERLWDNSSERPPEAERKRIKRRGKFRYDLLSDVEMKRATSELNTLHCVQPVAKTRIVFRRLGANSRS
jgi:hypothetical protein